MADQNDEFGLATKAFRIKRSIWIEPSMFYSQAFHSLSASGLITLMRCLQKRTWNNSKRHQKRGTKKPVYDDTGFVFPYGEAKLLGIGTTQHWKNIKTLIDVGFLDVVHQGGWYQKREKQKDYSVYRLSERWKAYGTQEFTTVEKPKVLQPEYYVRANLDRQKLRATSQKRSGQLHKSEGDNGKKTKSRLHESEAGGGDKKPVDKSGNAV